MPLVTGAELRSEGIQEAPPGSSVRNEDRLPVTGGVRRAGGVLVWKKLSQSLADHLGVGGGREGTWWGLLVLATLRALEAMKWHPSHERVGEQHSTRAQQGCPNVSRLPDLQAFEFFLMSTYLSEGETEHEQGRGRERQGGTESQAGSRL